jgi:hypothetical protein
VLRASCSCVSHGDGAPVVDVAMTVSRASLTPGVLSTAALGGRPEEQTGVSEKKIVIGYCYCHLLLLPQNSPTGESIQS